MGDVGQSVGQPLGHADSVGHGRSTVGQHDGVDHVGAGIRSRVVHGLGHPKVGAQHGDDCAGAVVGRVGVALAEGVGGGRVGDDQARAGRIHARGEGQAGCGPHVQGADGPDAGVGGIRARACAVVAVGQPGRQHIGQGHPAGHIDPVVGDAHPVGDQVGDPDQVGADALAHPQVHRLHGHHHAGRVVEQVGVRPVGEAHEGGVGQYEAAAGQVHLGGDDQAGRSAVGQRAHRPNSVGRVVAAQGGGGVAVAQATWQQVADRHLLGREGAEVSQADGEHDVGTHARGGVVHRLGQAEVGGREKQAGVQRAVARGGRQIHEAGASGVGVHVAIDGVVGAVVRDGEEVVGGRAHLDLVGARGQGVDEVEAGFVGAGLAGQVGARVVINAHQHVGQAGLVHILQAVLVQVVPDPVAQRGVLPLVQHQRAAAHQVQAARVAGLGGVQREGRHVEPVLGGRHVGRHQRVPVDQGVGGDAELFPLHVLPGQRLRADVGGGPEVFVVAPEYHGVEGDAGVAPVSGVQQDRGGVGGGIVAAVHGQDGGDPQGIVAAAVHDHEPLLGQVAKGRIAVAEDVVDALDVVVVAVPVAGVAEHVVHPAVDHVGQQDLLRGGHVLRGEQDVGYALDRPLLVVEQDVVGPGDGGVVHPHQADQLGQLAEDEVVGAHVEGVDDQVVELAVGEGDVVGVAGRERPGARARVGEVVRAVIGAVKVGLDGRDRGNRHRCAHPVKNSA